MTKTKIRTSLTEGPLFIRILTFTVPVILTRLLQVFYNVADNIIVGRYSNDFGALGAVGSSTPLTNLLLNLVLAFSTAAGVIIAQLYGAKKYDEVSRAAHSTMAIGLIFGVMLSIVGISLSGALLRSMDTQPVYYDKALIYVIIIFLGLPATSIYNFGAAILRSTGDSKTSLYVLSVSGLINVLLNLFFVICFNMSVDGVALATVISKYISAIWIVAVLLKRRSECYHINLRRVRLDFSHFLRVLRIGMPIAIQSALFSISNMTVVKVANTFPENVVSARTIVVNVDNIASAITEAFSVTSVSIVGQNYGAKKYRRLNKVLVYSLFLVTVVGILTSSIVFLLAEPISSLYISADNPNRELVIECALAAFKVMLSTYFICGIMSTLSGILKGLGRSILSTVAILIGLGLRIVWLVFVTPIPRFHTVFGLFFAYPISWLLSAIILAVLCVYAWHKSGIVKGARKEAKEF